MSGFGAFELGDQTCPEPVEEHKVHLYDAAIIDTSDQFVQTAAALGISVTAHEPLARHTTFRIGGPADLYAAATTTEQLERLAELAAEHGIPITVLGGGSNVLISDAGVRGLVVANQTRDYAWQTLAPADAPDEGSLARNRPATHRQLIADSGVLLAGLSANGYQGRFLRSRMGRERARHGRWRGDRQRWGVWEQHRRQPGRSDRHLSRPGPADPHRRANGVLLPQQPPQTPIGVGDSAASGADGNVRSAPRRCHCAGSPCGGLPGPPADQPAGEPSAGSIFRNPPGDHAGRLVEAAGLKGQRSGGAQISPRHANFIVNVENARAADVRALMDLMRQRVLESAGVELIPEILFVGEWHAA